MSLLHFPPELMARILLYLSPLDIISCRRTCRILYDLCNDSTLRYLVQMERCAVSDDMSPGLSYPERLHILEKREEAWAMLDFRRSVEVFIPFNPSSQYDFTGGTFLLGTALDCESRHLTIGYSCIPLPSLSDPQDQNLEWKGCSLETEILDVGLAVEEHDLIAAVTAWVLLVLLVRPKFDFREAKTTCAMYLRRVRSWNCGYSVFQPADLIHLRSSPSSSSTRRFYLLKLAAWRLKLSGTSSSF